MFKVFRPRPDCFRLLSCSVACIDKENWLREIGIRAFVIRNIFLWLEFMHGRTLSKFRERAPDVTLMALLPFALINASEEEFESLKD